MALLAIIESGAEGAEARHVRSTGALPVKDTEEGFVPVAPDLPEAPYVSGGRREDRRGSLKNRAYHSRSGHLAGRRDAGGNLRPVAADSASDGA